ncbi:MAG: hypothetical protein ACE5GE_12610, partial [Phycisphaerae bacterium]
WGMNERLGFVAYAEEQRQNMWMDLPGNRDYSEETSKAIDEEVQKIIENAYRQAHRIVSEHKEQIEAIKEALMKYETITGDEINALIRGETLDKPSVGDLLDDAQTPKSDSVGQARPISADPDAKPDLGSGPLPLPG